MGVQPFRALDMSHELNGFLDPLQIRFGLVDHSYAFGFYPYIYIYNIYSSTDSAYGESRPGELQLASTGPTAAALADSRRLWRKRPRPGTRAPQRTASAFRSRLDLRQVI